MKKQLLIFATITTFVFVSCSKEKIETPAGNRQPEEVTRANSPGGPVTINSLSVGLLGRYEFNSTLRDTTGKLEDAWPAHGRYMYGPDRKGQANKALRFNGAYGMDIYDIPYTPEKASVSFWVKDDMIEGPGWYRMLGSDQAFIFQQNENEFNCSFNKVYYGIVQQVGTSPVNSSWHHVVAIRDNTSMKLYIDGVLIGTTSSPVVDFGSWLFHNYTLGYGGGVFWKGSLDDVRFYKRVLSLSEIIALKNL
jgi:hypothetical protein